MQVLIKTCISWDLFSKFYYSRLFPSIEIYYDVFSKWDVQVLKIQLHTHIHYVKRNSDFVECHDFASFTMKPVETKKTFGFQLTEYHLIKFLPTTTISNERAFIVFYITKIELHNKVGDEWLNYMMIC